MVCIFRVRKNLLGKFQPIFILFMFVTALEDNNALIIECLTSIIRCSQKGASFIHDSSNKLFQKQNYESLFVSNFLNYMLYLQEGT